MNKSKFTILAIIALFTVFSALCQKVVKVPSQQKLKDAHDISESFKENVEYFRLFSDTTEFGKCKTKVYHPYAYYDPDRAFMRYALRYNTKKEKYVPSPLPTKDQIDVSVEWLNYNADSLKCFAILYVSNNYSKLEDFEDAPADTVKCNVTALIGIRESIKDKFKIYPPSIYEVNGVNGSNENGAIYLWLYYKKYLALQYAEGTVYDAPMRRGIQDDDFFEEAAFFDKIEGIYKFQLYRQMQYAYKREYLSNQPDSVKEQWIKGKPYKTERIPVKKYSDNAIRRITIMPR